MLICVQVNTVHLLKCDRLKPNAMIFPTNIYRVDTQIALHLFLFVNLQN